MSGPLVTKIHPGAMSNFGLSRVIVGTTDLSPELTISEPWSPFIYRDGGRVQESDFICTELLVLDIDNDGARILSLHDAMTKFAKYKCIISTTKSHQTEKVTKAGKTKPPQDRYRVILYLSEPITSKEDFKETFFKFLADEDLIGIVDPLADTARFFFPSINIAICHTFGEDIKVTFAPKTIQTTVPTTRALETIPSAGKGWLSMKTLEFLSGMDSHENWHSRFITAAFDLKSQGYSFEEAKEKLKRASPNLMLDEVHDIPQLLDIYNKRDPYKVKVPKWPAIIQTKGGGILPDPQSIENLEYLITDMLGYKLYYDTRRQNVRKAETNTSFNDNDLNKVTREAFSHRILRDARAIQAAVSEIASRDARDLLKENIELYKYDPTIDKVDYIKELFNTMKFDEDTTSSQLALYKLMLRRWLIGIVRKIYYPGSENNVLVFVGQQGKGKSRWLAKLASIWHEGYKEGHVDPSNKDHEIAHLHYFLWHVAELDSTTNSKDVGALKDFFTKSTVKVRKAYDRYETEGDSICSFCASVNSLDFLHDTSGNRRYLVIPITGLNPDHNIGVGRIFAQAKYLMDSGERQWFDEAEIGAINENAERFRFKDLLLELLDERAEPGEDLLTINDIIAILEAEYPSIKYTKTMAISASNLFFKKGIKHIQDKSNKRFLINRGALTTKSTTSLKKVLGVKPNGAN